MVATNAYLRCGAFCDFANRMPEIQSVCGMPLADWLRDKAPATADDVLRLLAALGVADVVVNAEHPDWRSPDASGLSPQQHLLQSFESYCEQDL